MGTLVAVKKGAEVCIATSAWNLREPWMRGEQHATPHCIVKVGESYIGLASSVAFQLTFERYIAGLPKTGIPSLGSRNEIFDFFSQAHEALRHQMGMNPAYQAGQEFEWTPMNALLINRTGIYRVDSSRGVYEFRQYWSYGSGESFALGAMFVAYESTELTAAQVAQKGLEAAAQFEGVPLGETVSYTIKAPTLVMSGGTGVSSRAKKEKGKTIKLPTR